jgi:hypothetical protein
VAYLFVADQVQQLRHHGIQPMVNHIEFCRLVLYDFVDASREAPRQVVIFQSRGLPFELGQAAHQLIFRK